MIARASLLLIVLPVALAACENHSAGPAGETAPGDRTNTEPYSGIAAEETVNFTGTEPFWGGEATALA